MSSHSADRSSSGIAGVAAPALAAAVAALPGDAAAGKADDLTATPAPDSPVTVGGAGVVTGKTPCVSGPYVYGYDSAGIPTLTDAGYNGSSERKPRH